jgi:hypothetical protein
LACSATRHFRGAVDRTAEEFQTMTMTKAAIVLTARLFSAGAGRTAASSALCCSASLHCAASRRRSASSVANVRASPACSCGGLDTRAATHGAGSARYTPPIAGCHVQSATAGGRGRGPSAVAYAARLPPPSPPPPGGRLCLLERLDAVRQNLDQRSLLLLRNRARRTRSAGLRRPATLGGCRALHRVALRLGLVLGNGLLGSPLPDVGLVKSHLPRPTRSNTVDSAHVPPPQVSNGDGLGGSGLGSSPPGGVATRRARR